VVLCGVDVVGVWRPRQQGRTLRIDVRWAGPRCDVGPEAERLAVVRGSAGVVVECGV